MSDETCASVSRYIENQQETIPYIAGGKTKEQALAIGEVPSYILDVAYSNAHPWALPSPAAEHAPGDSCSFRAAGTSMGDDQTGADCQGAGLLPLDCRLYPEASVVDSGSVQSDQSQGWTGRLSDKDPPIHPQDGAVGQSKGLCLGEQLLKEIDEAIALKSSEVISPRLSLLIGS